MPIISTMLKPRPKQDVTHEVRRKNRAKPSKEAKRRKAKSLQHEVFPGGHPSKY